MGHSPFKPQNYISLLKMDPGPFGQHNLNYQRHFSPGLFGLLTVVSPQGTKKRTKEIAHKPDIGMSSHLVFNLKTKEEKILFELKENYNSLRLFS